MSTEKTGGGKIENNCLICDKYFNRTNALIHHIKNWHRKNDDTNTDTYIDKTTEDDDTSKKYIDETKVNMKIVPPSMRGDETDEAYKCSQCIKLRQHFEINPEV